MKQALGGKWLMSPLRVPHQGEMLAQHLREHGGENMVGEQSHGESQQQ